jgi:hypothetical protein
MLRSRGADGSNFELLLTQVLQGMGGGIAALTIQVSSQASVPHGDVARQSCSSSQNLERQVAALLVGSPSRKS